MEGGGAPRAQEAGDPAWKSGEYRLEGAGVRPVPAPAATLPPPTSCWRLAQGPETPPSAELQT